MLRYIVFKVSSLDYIIRSMPTIRIKCNFPTKKGETRATMSGLQKSGESPDGSERLIFVIKKAYICIKEFCIQK